MQKLNSKSLMSFRRGSEFSSYEIELQKRVSQNEVTFQVTNSKIFIEILLSTYLLDFIKY